jgi:tripartite-type tricarboxylate transporter receptor subunit TctC
MVNGTLDLTLSYFSSALPLIKSGKVRPLAVTTLRRHPLLPDVPTVAEQGFPGFESAGWNGVLAPAGTPRAIIERVHQALAAALATPEARDLFIGQGNELSGLGPQDYAAFLKAQIEQYADIARAAGISKM